MGFRFGRARRRLDWEALALLVRREAYATAQEARNQYGLGPELTHSPEYAVSQAFYNLADRLEGRRS